jgi:Putative transposase DNA-binding domain
VVIEDLNVAGMLKNHSLALAIRDVGWGAFRRQPTYKAAWYGCRVVVADRCEKSSKTCCRRSWVDENLTLKDRMFRCHNAAWMQVIDRDLNAATNLEQLAGSSPDRIHACGEGSAGLSRTAQVKLPSLKQEPNSFSAEAENGTFWRTGTNHTEVGPLCAQKKSGISLANAAETLRPTQSYRVDGVLSSGNGKGRRR